MQKPLSLSSIADDLALSNPTLQRLKSLGIISALDLYGLAKSNPEDLAQELGAPLHHISLMARKLRKYIPDEVLDRLDAAEKLPPLSFGAELDQECDKNS